MKNDYAKGGSEPKSGRYGYSYGYGSYGGGYDYGGGYGAEAGGENSPQRSFQDYLMMFRERIWYLIVVFFIIFFGSILYTVKKTKIYTAAATVQLLRDDPSALGVDFDMEQNQIRTAEDLNTQISVFQSNSIIQGVEQRIQEEMRERFMAPYIDALSLGGHSQRQRY